VELYNQIVELGIVFDKLTAKMAENTKSKRRRTFMQSLDEIKEYNKKVMFLDKKIEFDQMFFTGNYAKFSMMISDIRKQIRINEEILKLQM